GRGGRRHNEPDGRTARRGGRFRYARGSLMTLAELADFAGKASTLVLHDEVGDDAVAAAELKALMRSRITEMRDAITRGLSTTAPSRTGMVGWNAKTLDEAADALS